MLNIKAIGFLKNTDKGFVLPAGGNKECPEQSEYRQIRDIPSMAQPYFGSSKGAKRTTAQVCDEIYAPLIQTQEGKKGLELLKGLDNKFARKIYSGRGTDKIEFAIFLDALDEKSLITLEENIKTLNTLAPEHGYITERIYPFIMPKILQRDPKQLESSLDTLKSTLRNDLDLVSRGTINDIIAGTDYNANNCSEEFVKSYERFKLICEEMCITPEEGFNMLLDKMIADDKKEGD